MPTKQEIFDKVVTHLRAQGKKSETSGSLGDNCEYVGCAYRTSDGLSCAVGCLIPKEHYSALFEGMSASDLIEDYPFLSAFLGRDKHLLLELQAIHDHSDVEEWEQEWKQCAERFSLTYSERP